MERPESGVGEFRITDTTLREGEQFAGAHFSSKDRINLALQLDAFGVEEIEVPSPVVSPIAADDLRTLRSLGLRAAIRPHLRCRAADIELALSCGVDGVHLFLGASAHLGEHSLRQSLDESCRLVAESVSLAASAGVFTRFSTEDAFRTPRERLLRLLDAAVAAGAHRLGLPDTVGVATPRQVESLFREIAARYPGVGLEFHGHNDAGCAVANALAALEGGASAINVTVLGIGERTGIASLSGLVARLYTIDPALVSAYQLHLLPELDQMVAGLAGVSVPFCQPITGASAFTHVAGVHSNATLASPDSYEVINPADFGLAREMPVISRLTGRRAVAHFARHRLGLELDADQSRRATWAIKGAAEAQRLDEQMVEQIVLRNVGGNFVQEVG